MKRIFTLSALTLGSILPLTVFTLASCGDDAPQVTYVERITASSPSTISPKSSSGETLYILYDGNRFCTDDKYDCFKITKDTQKINATDKCERCQKSWNEHKKD